MINKSKIESGKTLNNIKSNITDLTLKLANVDVKTVINDKVLSMPNKNPWAGSGIARRNRRSRRGRNRTRQQRRNRRSRRGSRSANRNRSARRNRSRRTRRNQSRQ